MEERYIHGDSGPEQHRLSLLNTMTNDSFIRYLGVEDGFEVCDLGCGLGNLMTDIARVSPSARITGVEISERQYASALRNVEGHDSIRVVNRDLFENGLPDNHFDITYCRYVLEHVPDPVRAVWEMSRVTKPGGLVISQENDLRNVLYYPDIQGMDTVMKALCRLQKTLGGDPYVGRKLFDIYRRASLDRIQLSYEPEIHTEDDPEDYRAWMENALGILVGARSDMVDRGLVEAAAIERVCHAMKMRIERPAGVALFHWNRIKARKPLR
jgi:ubiquinone/menaquinone biosynthesis C-methylase UbiE